ncbi:MAG: hypothetical protein FWG75_01485 [Cystobacterineae bacterium]|nr:hypothetical protein [Cystobacterineae bacterium]
MNIQLSCFKCAKLAFTLALGVGLACSGEAERQNSNSTGLKTKLSAAHPDVPWTQLGSTPAELSALSQKKVFLAHNTVGSNLVSGLRRVAPGLSIRSGSSASSLSAPTLLEHLISYEARPLEKIAAFENLVNNLGPLLDIALIKLSHIDFDKFVGIRVEDITTAYAATISRLQARFPHVVFAHVTAPLYTRAASWDNASREQFNAWLRTTYKGHVFDLAALEAMRADGSLALALDGRSPALADEWAQDTHQLNTEGANRIATSLIGFLASDFSCDNTPEPECRIGDNSCPANHICIGLDSNVQGAPGACQLVEPEPECRIGDNSCPANHICIGLDSNAQGAPGACQLVEPEPECRIGDNSCPANHICIGLDSNAQGAPGACQLVEPEPECRIGDNSCPANHICIGLDSNAQGAPGTCVREQVDTGEPWTSVEFSPADLNALRLRKVFFGHNSVGQNTIDGMKRVASTLSIRSANSSNLNAVIGQLGTAPALVEYLIDNNGNPLAKINAFENAMKTVGNRVDIAFMKLCYADFPTNINNLIAAYEAAMNRLQRDFPSVLFIHITAPLYDWNASWDNASREQFNTWLRTTYKGRVFDLATIESIRPNGTIALSRDNKTIALANEWTSDGGHLNESGANRMGSGLIGFLASQPLKTDNILLF